MTSQETDVGSIVIGLLLVALAGCLNGSWNASFSPKLGIAVDRSNNKAANDNNDDNDVDHVTKHQRDEGEETDTTGIQFHMSWTLFQIYAAIINIPICIYWIGGPERTAYVIRNAPTKNILLVSVFSVLWGVGSVLFGLACQIVGVGVGTNLVMGVIMCVSDMIM